MLIQVINKYMLQRGVDLRTTNLQQVVMKFIMVQHNKAFII